MGTLRKDNPSLLRKLARGAFGGAGNALLLSGLFPQEPGQEQEQLLDLNPATSLPDPAAQFGAMQPQSSGGFLSSEMFAQLPPEIQQIIRQQMGF